MIKMSEAMAIALHSMIYIANRENELCTVKDIAKKFSISENHLSKVLQRLVKCGFLTSIKGPKGGFSIVSGVKNTTFMEIYNLIEGKPQKHNCLFNASQKDCQKCIMSNLIDKMTNEFIEYMENNKISDFVI